jgi:hypothetical protein
LTRIRLAAQKTQCASKNSSPGRRCFATAILSIRPNEKSKQKGKRAMAKLKFNNLPQGNPCAQCGKAISTPEWIESGPGRISYLWHCWACDYQFEAVAFFEQDAESEPLAA